MKIALVCPYNMFEKAGGVHQVIVHLHDGLVKKGHSVKIITPKPAGFKNKIPQDYILLGTTRNFSGGFGANGNWGLPADTQDIKAVLDRENFDVINFHEPWAPMLAWQMLSYSKAAHVGTFHANLVDSVAAKSWVNVFLPYGRGIGQKMHVLTAVSPAPAALLINKARDKAELKQTEEIKYIPNGIDLKLYKPPKKRQPLSGDGTKTVVYVGRLDRRKGIEWLIKAFAQLTVEMPNAHLLVVGEGSLLPKLKQLALSLGIKNIKFTGYVTDDEKRHLLGNADLFCAPSLFGESFGIVLLEAMAMGTPLLAGNNMGYINVMTGHGRLGLIDPKATTDFANRLSVFLADDSIRKLIRDWGLDAAKQYDYPKVVDLYEAAYQEAVKKWRIERHLSIENGKHNKRFWKTGRRLFVRRHAG